MSDEAQKFPGLTPDQIIQEQLDAKNVLDYGPQIVEPKTPAKPFNVSSDGSQGATGETHYVTEHLVNTIGMFRDIVVLTQYHTDAIAVLEQNLKNVRIPTTGFDTHTLADQILLEATYKDSISFADYQQALANPNDQISVLVTKTWNRFQWSYDGTIDAQLYGDLLRYKEYLQVIEDTAVNTIALQAFSFGSTSNNIGSNLNYLNDLIVNNTFTLNDEDISSYVTVVDTLSATTSQFFFSFQAIDNAIAADCNLGNNAGNLVIQLAQGIENDRNTSALSKIISILSTLRTLFNIYNATSWLSMENADVILNQLADQIFNFVMAEAMNVYSHIQFILLQPLLGLVRNFDFILGHQKQNEIDTFLGNLVIMLEGVVGKYQKYALDFYRRMNLHNDGTLNKTLQTDKNNKLRNTVRTVDEILFVLKALQYTTGSGTTGVNWSHVAQTVGIGLKASYCKNNPLPSVPSLSIARPPQGADILTIVSGPDGFENGEANSGPGTVPKRWGGVSIGNQRPHEAVSPLLDDIKRLRSF